MEPSTAPRTRAPGLATLWLPLSEPGSTWLAAGALCVAYCATMARDLSLYDSGELALVAVRLGLGHPPGQPLHTLLGYALCRLPLLPPLVAVGLASVLPGALTLLPATSLAQALLGASPSREALRATPWLLALAALHPSLWEPATRVEVYALATFFAVWAAARLATSPVATLEPTAPYASLHLFYAGLALGLCASVNPMIALCSGAAFAPAIVLRIVQQRLPVRSLFHALGGGALGLLPYLYVLAVAQRRDVLIWGAPRDAASLWHYLTLHDYINNQRITGPIWVAHIGAWFVWATEQLLLPLIVLGWLAHVQFGRRAALGRVAAALALILLVTAFSSSSVWHLDIPDYNGYVATGFWLALAGVAALCAEAAAQGRTLAACLLVVTVACCVSFAAPRLFERSRQHDHVARLLAERVLAAAPARAIVIAEADHLAGALFYLQEAERARPDVVVLAYGLSSSGWHWEHIYALHPDLTPIALQGPGAKLGRVKRFLAAQAERPVLIERFELARALGLQLCPGTIYLRTGLACAEQPAPDVSLAVLLEHMSAELGDGSPGAVGAIAQTSYTIADGLLRMGYLRAGFRMLLAGVPQGLRPVRPPSFDLPERAAPFSPRAIGWLRSVALGDPARNLFLAGLLLLATNQPDAAFGYVQAARRDGLPEAIELIERAR